MSDWELQHLTIVAKMVRAKVTGEHHKQKDTIRRWCSSIDGDVLSKAMDELCADPNAPVYEKGRGTISLSSLQDGKNFLESHDEDDEFVWFY